MKVFKHSWVGCAATTANDHITTANIRPLAIAVFGYEARHRASTIPDQIYGPRSGQNGDTPILDALGQQGLHYIENGHAIHRTPLIARDQIGIIHCSGYRLTVTYGEAIFSKPVDRRSAMVR